MGSLSVACTICGAEFEPQFRYQMEERVETHSDGTPQARFVFFCSQRCLEASHAEGDEGTATCDSCSASFRVELASQVLFTGGRRRYACSSDCRAQVLAEAHGARLGEVTPPAGAGTPVETPNAVDSESADADHTAALGRVHDTIRTPPPVTIRPANDARPAEETVADGGGPRVIAVFNHKGGTGKTTTAVTIAAALAARGKRTLLVDTDGQGNVAVSLALRAERSLYHVLVMGLPVADAVVSAAPNLDVLPANETLAAAELYLAGRRNRDRVLASRVGPTRQDYEYVIVDCSPSLSLMNQNALVMADAVLCPVACDYLSLVGVRQVLRTIKGVNKHLNHPVRLWGVLPTMFDARAKICHEALDTLREHFGERCFDPVRLAIRVKEAPAQGKTLLEYAPGSNATADYLRVVDRLLGEVGQAREVQLEAGVAQ
jgi:chromosome partitioning protein